MPESIFQPNKMRLLPLFLLLLWLGCKETPKPEERVRETKSTPKEIIIAKDTIKKVEPIKIKYYAIKNKDSIVRAAKYFDTGQFKVILAINRIDSSKLFKTKMLVIPDTFFTDLKYYSPFPDSIPLLDSIKQILLISYPAQAFATYENGKQTRWGATSMGKKSTPTPTGLFHTNWKAKTTLSTDDSTWVLDWYFNLDNFRGVSLHKYDLPGYPASHACMRLYEEDAKWLYYWAEQWKLDPTQVKIQAHGTPVLIFGDYDFSASPPWYKLPENPNVLDITADTLAYEIKPKLPLILERQYELDSVIKSRAEEL